MSLKSIPLEKEAVVILDLKGRLTLGEGTGALREKVREMLERGCHRIVLNLHEVTYMDSSALGELVAAHQAVADAGGDMKLMHLPVRLRNVLTMTKLYMVFDIFDDESDAIRSFPAQTELQVRYTGLFERLAGQKPAAMPHR